MTITCSSGNLLTLSIHFFNELTKVLEQQHYNSSTNKTVVLINVEDHLLQREFLFTAREHGRDGLHVWHKGDEKCSSSCVGEIQTSRLQKKLSHFGYFQVEFFLITQFTRETKKTVSCACPLSKPIHCYGGETTAISSWQSITLSSYWVIKWCLQFP